MYLNNNLNIESPSVLDMMAGGLVRTRFQSIVSTREQTIIGLEALSYGLHPETGDRVPPDVLFAQAKEEGVCLELDRFCREQAMLEFKKKYAETGEYLLWVNLETSILKKGVVGTGRLLESVLKSGLTPSRVVVEIVESEVSELSALKEFVDRHKAHGFLIALDDVGTGHSNLERIALIKPDIIKIDRFLVRGLHTVYYKYEAVRALNSLCQGIGALPVAEGIETTEEALAVLDLGINLHQGFYYAHPDQPYAEQMSGSQVGMDDLAASFRDRRISFFSKRQAYFRVITATVERIVQLLAEQKAEAFETILRQAINDKQDLECLYVLDAQGVQITQTICNYSKILRPKSSLFKPASKGTDLSLKEYFLLIKAGLPRFVSDPYISRASGNLCVTISYAFTGTDDARYVLCADCDCERETVLCASTPSRMGRSAAGD